MATDLTIPLSLKPMEAEPVDDLPKGNWLYEPKYDGFRCLAFRNGDKVDLQSKKQKSLNRFFPEVAAGLAGLKADRFVLDGELVIPGQSFETLQLRLHPAASRIAGLSGKFPARLVVFDLLADDNRSLIERPFSERRAALKAFVEAVGQNQTIVLSKAARSAATARKWLSQAGLDGIVAKPLDQPYRPGERAMRKFKVWHTVDAVLAGYYEDEATGNIDSLLFGLYGDDGLLHFVGHSRVYDDRRRDCPAPQAAEERKGLYRQDSRRKEPVDGQDAEDGQARSGPGGRTQRRSHQRWPVPAWFTTAALANRQGPGRLHDGSNSIACGLFGPEPPGSAPCASA